MIVTVAPNPSLDRTIVVDFLKRGAVNRASVSSSEPSGKGVNVAVALNAHGIDVVAVLPVGGFSGFQVVQLLDALGVPHVSVPITGEVRSNISLIEPDAIVTKINEVGPTLSPDEASRLVRAVLNRLDEGDWLVASGTLPAGAVEAIYPSLVRGAQEVGARVAIDTSGEPLDRAIAAGPDLIKPNVSELSDVTGRDIVSLGDVVMAAESLRERGAGAVLASIGPDGAVLVADGGRWHAAAPAIEVVSAVGAGDALLAGFVAAGGAGPEALRTAMGWAASAVQLPGTLSASSAPSIPIDITGDIDFGRKLTAPCRTSDAPDI
ncbi:hypothetical protein ASE16_17230 [Leifsonia sp. Root227]|uniref:1-phosphofructokinase family hexose kinase n=1 Tax=unclassified Leifsonia TaxID=2663824 RepID=UPI0006F2B4BB|nr:1-phosphofructokinase family hexose kinase [Leifsonia sp. Root227]KRC47097.1 hypothetical protein ASE16_17230 [Leifsonia sp. Root227]